MGLRRRRRAEASMTRLARLLLPLPLLLAAIGGAAQAPARSPLLGRWDLTVEADGGTHPSWLEIRLSGRKTLVGSYVGRGGSQRPISHIKEAGGRFQFTLPVQWEEGPDDLAFEGALEGETLKGTVRMDDGKRLTWTGVRAPSLTRSGEPRWGQPVELLNGKDLTGWRPRTPRRAGARSGWVVEGGILRNAVPGNDLVTEQTFTDFRLRAEFRYPAGSNCGIYLRGRYEAQIEDNYGRPPESHLMGGIYGFLTPRVNAARPAGEWQTYDLTLVGRHVTVVLNEQEVITRQEIPGITGGALDSREGEPGPIMLQGDHGRVDFRRLTLTPAL
jgi:hypothetical protein